MPKDKTVGYSIFKTSTANLCTCINRHSSFMDTRGEVKSLYKTSNQVKNNKAGGEKKLNVRGESQEDAEPRRPAGCAEVSLSLTVPPPSG